VNKDTGGMCFHGAFMNIGTLLGRGIPGGNIKVCHGTCWSANLNVWIQHGWLEVQGCGWLGADITCFDYASDELFMPRDQYYLIGHIRNVRRYSVQEALELATEHGHSGPWEEIEGE